MNEIITTAKKKRLKNVIMWTNYAATFAVDQEMVLDKRGPSRTTDFGSKTHHNQEAGSPQSVPTSNESGCSRSVSESKAQPPPPATLPTAIAVETAGSRVQLKDLKAKDKSLMIAELRARGEDVEDGAGYFGVKKRLSKYTDGDGMIELKATQEEGTASPDAPQAEHGGTQKISVKSL